MILLLSILHIRTFGDYLLIFFLTMFKPIVLAFFVSLVLGQYNPDLSKSLCELTVASYCRPTKILDWSCAPCQNSGLQIQNISLFVNSTKATLGYIAVSKKLDAIMLVFRGTQPWLIKNWISDINFIAIYYPVCDNRCKVHQGFYYAYTDIHSQVLEKVKTYQQLTGIQKIVIVGHSLGGALATHAAAHLIKAGFKIDLLETYGSPRVGDKMFSKWFQEIYSNTMHPRVTHGKDPVPHLPPKDWAFEHVQTEIFYEGSLKKGYKICNDANGEDNNCSNKYLIDGDVLDHVSYYDIDFSAVVLACQ